jgi:glucose-6-phosphate 1-dehydrogenase
MAEDIGVGSRAGYYDGVGATRDVIQNHLLQLYALTAMEPPVSMGSADLRRAKEAVLKATRLAGTPEQASARGQYSAGWQGSDHVGGYLDEPGVPADSKTDTFGAIKLVADTSRWSGTPFYLRAGKRLPRRVTEIALTMRREDPFRAEVPDALRQGLTEIASSGLAGLDTEIGKAGGMDVVSFPDPEAGWIGIGANTIVVRVQPDQGVSLKFGAQVPEDSLAVRDVTMDFAYGHAFTTSIPEAYERLLLDVLLGTDPLFPRQPEIAESWRIIDPVEEYWDSLPTAPQPYAPGTWGPESARELLARDNRTWRQ